MVLDACRRMGNNDIALLKCTSSYPAPIAEANMCMVKDLAERYGVISGLSDHTMGSIVVTVFWAKIIEKHFILDIYWRTRRVIINGLEIVYSYGKSSK